MYCAVVNCCLLNLLLPSIWTSCMISLKHRQLHVNNYEPVSQRNVRADVAAEQVASHELAISQFVSVPKDS